MNVALPRPPAAARALVLIASQRLSDVPSGKRDDGPGDQAALARARALPREGKLVLGLASVVRLPKTCAQQDHL